MRPDSVGKKILWLNPGVNTTTFTTADLAAIDTVANTAASNIAPYAYTATVRDDYDTARYANAGIAAIDLLSTQRVAFGVFLSPENDKGNLLFQLSANVNVLGDIANDDNLRVRFFFGRKATNNTVVSSKAAVSNSLANYIWLPNNIAFCSGALGFPSQISSNIESELFGLTLSGGFVWCFGFAIDNMSANTASIQFDSSISCNKYRGVLEHFRPSGSA